MYASVRNSQYGINMIAILIFFTCAVTHALRPSVVFYRKQNEARPLEQNKDLQQTQAAQTEGPLSHNNQTSIKNQLEFQTEITPGGDTKSQTSSVLIETQKNLDVLKELSEKRPLIEFRTETENPSSVNNIVVTQSKQIELEPKNELQSIQTDAQTHAENSEEIKNMVINYFNSIPDIESKYILNKGLSRTISHYFKGKVAAFPLFNIKMKIDRRKPVKIPWAPGVPIPKHRHAYQIVKSI